MTFSPPVAGPVVDLDVAFDVGCGQACWPATLLPVVRQGSVNYVWNGTPVNVWTATAAGTTVGQVAFPMLVPSQFDDALGNHPDPSCNAGPWRFGFRAASGYSNPTGCGAYPAYWIDNFSVTIRFTSSGCNPAYAGTGEDLLLTTGVNGPANGILIKSATANDYVHLEMASGGGTFVYAPAYLVAQAVLTGANPPSPPGLAFIHVDPGLVTILYGGTTPIPLILPPGGVSASGQVPAGLGGVSILFQGAVITPLSANGIVAATSLHEIQIL